MWLVCFVSPDRFSYIFFLAKVKRNFYNKSMITQCPKCQKTQEIPNHYKGQLIKCLHCKEQFAAWEYREPSEIIIPYTPLPPKPPFPLREYFFNAIEVMAIIWLIFAFIGMMNVYAVFDHTPIYDYKDTLWRDMYEQIVKIHDGMDSRLFAIQCLLAGCLFCLASIAKK